jgi:hypothetical protein
MAGNPTEWPASKARDQAGHAFFFWGGFPSPQTVLGREGEGDSLLSARCAMGNQDENLKQIGPLRIQSKRGEQRERAKTKMRVTVYI